jgi:hypothetical protein
MWHKLDHRLIGRVRLGQSQLDIMQKMIKPHLNNSAAMSPFYFSFILIKKIKIKKERKGWHVRAYIFHDHNNYF